MAKQIKKFTVTTEYDGEGNPISARVNGSLNDSNAADLSKGLRYPLDDTELNNVKTKTMEQVGTIIVNRVKALENIS